MEKNRPMTAPLSAEYSIFTDPLCTSDGTTPCFCRALRSTRRIVRNYHALEKEKRDVLRATAPAQQAQLETLRSQVNTHFLFNALTSIHALIRENPARAQTAVEELSELLRRSLAPGGAGMAQLSEEIAVLERYLALERFALRRSYPSPSRCRRRLVSFVFPFFFCIPARKRDQVRDANQRHASQKSD
jgi:Histidine kinase